MNSNLAEAFHIDTTGCERHFSKNLHTHAVELSHVYFHTHMIQIRVSYALSHVYENIYDTSGPSYVRIVYLLLMLI